MDTGERKKIRSHRDWEVYRKAFEAAMDIFQGFEEFPEGRNLLSN